MIYLMVTLSVLIPVHDPNQEYEDYISDALSSISIQKHKPDQVLLVANHEISYLESLRSRFRETVEIEFKISQANSAAENINFGVRESKGQFVKLLFQDDKLIGDDCLTESLRPLLKNQFKWSVVGSVAVDRTSQKIVSSLLPKYTRKIILGTNLIGAPSVVCFNKDFYIPMDSQLKYMFDCDWYLRMAHNFGKPFEVKKIAIEIGVHEGQATHWAKDLSKAELQILDRNHKRKSFIPTLTKVNCVCLAN
jgi:hypothetical protein